MNNPPFGLRARRTVRQALARFGLTVTRTPDPFAAQARALQATEIETVLDVGANVGNTVAAYRRHFPHARVFAFEPFPDCVQRLSERFAEDAQVDVIPCAVADEMGSTQLHVSGGASTHSLLDRSETGARYFQAHAAPRGRIEVDVTTLDAFCAERGIGRGVLLKIDVEGAERRVLAGAGGLLESGGIPLVYLEVMFTEHYAGQALYHELAQMLADYGYALYDLIDLRRDPETLQLRYGNALFLAPGSARTAPARAG